MSKKAKTLTIPAIGDRDRRVRQADRIARVLRVFSLIQSGKNYDAQSIATELGCSKRTVARDLETLTFAEVPWYFDKASNSYRLPPNYRFPIRFAVGPHSQSNRDDTLRDEPIKTYGELFRDDEPMTQSELQFMARWLHETHRLGEIPPASRGATRDFQKLKLPSIALTNFYNAFMIPFRSRPNDFIRTVWDADVLYGMLPWKTTEKFLQRNDEVTQWLQQFDPKSVSDIRPYVEKYRD